MARRIASLTASALASLLLVGCGSHDGARKGAPADSTANAALLATSILANRHPWAREALRQYRENLTASVPLLPEEPEEPEVQA